MTPLAMAVVTRALPCVSPRRLAMVHHWAVLHAVGRRVVGMDPHLGHGVDLAQVRDVAQRAVVVHGQTALGQHQRVLGVRERAFGRLLVVAQRLVVLRGRLQHQILLLEALRPGEAPCGPGWCWTRSTPRTSWTACRSPSPCRWPRPRPCTRSRCGTPLRCTTRTRPSRLLLPSSLQVVQVQLCFSYSFLYMGSRSCPRP